ncbi:MAG: hypothetical protein WCO63_12810 [Bacteroidota bacterium]
MNILVIDCPGIENFQNRSIWFPEFEEPFVYTEVCGIANAMPTLATGDYQLIILYRRELSQHFRDIMLKISCNYPDLQVIINHKNNEGEEYSYLGRGMYLSEIEQW